MDRREDGGRYRLLETVREYALDRLQQADDADDLHRRHAVYVLDLAERVQPEAVDPAHAALLEREQQNVRAALGWALARGEAELGLRLGSAACTLWYLRGRHEEGQAWLEPVLALSHAADSAVGAAAQIYLGRLLLTQGAYADAEQRLQAALARQRARQDELG